MLRKKRSPQTETKDPLPSSIGKAAHGSKSAFVRNLLEDLSAKEVVEKAKAEGMTLSIAQVYNIRSTSKRKGAIKNAAKPRMSGVSPRRPSTDASDSEARLRKLIAEVGLARAREVLVEVGAAFAG